VLRRQAIAQRHADGAQRDVRTTSRQRVQNAALAKHDSLYCRIVGQHGQHHIAVARFRNRTRDSAPSLRSASARSRVR